MGNDSARHGEGVATAAAALVALVVVAAIAWASGAHRANDGGAAATIPAATATALANQLVERTPLPTGATRYGGAPPAIIDHPWENVQTPNLVDVHEVWIVPAADATVLAFVRAQKLPGMPATGCCGTSGGPNFHIDNVTFGPTTPFPKTGSIVSAQVLVTVTARTATTTWVRVDAQVVWRARRDPATLVPAADRVITLTAVPEPTDAPTPRPLVVTDATNVRRLGHLFNTLPVAVPGADGCGRIDDGTDYTVAFRRNLTAEPDVTATLTCSIVTAHASGRQVTLDDDGFKDAVFEHLGRQHRARTQTDLHPGVHDSGPTGP